MPERSRHFGDIREHPLAIYQAPGGASNALDLKCLQGLARGNQNLQTPKGMSGLWGLDLIAYCTYSDSTCRDSVDSYELLHFS